MIRVFYKTDGFGNRRVSPGEMQCKSLTLELTFIVYVTVFPITYVVSLLLCMLYLNMHIDIFV